MSALGHESTPITAIIDQAEIDHVFPMPGIGPMPFSEARAELDGQPSPLQMAIWGPVPYLGTGKSYADVSPRTSTDTRPLPLDPARAYNDGLPAIPKILYDMLPLRVDRLAQQVQMSESDASRLLRELQFEVGLRLERNHFSMERLRESLYSAEPVDDVMLDIVRRARSGNANMDEMVRLIKEHPAMISLEAFKFTKPLDWAAANEADVILDANVARLTRTFRDAEITPYANGDAKLLKQPFFDKNGMLVVKHVIADVKSKDSFTELVRKHTYMLFDRDDALVGIPPHLVQLNSQNGPQLVNIQPISTTAYLRARDYQTRQGYIAPTGERTAEISLLENDAEHHKKLCAKIGDAASQAAYLEAVRWANGNLAPLPKKPEVPQE